MKSITTREPVRAGNPGAPGDWAICCSGGGIRSAAYCLGALQSLGRDGLVAKARWILGVSGGGYIAASRALVARDLPRGTQPRAYASGTPEVLVGAVLALLWISDGARAGYSPGQLLPVGVALAVVLAARVVVNVNRLSMHDYYRWRLANALAVTREAAQERNPRRARALFARAAATRLSALRDSQDEPGLVICGTANINAEREVPPGKVAGGAVVPGHAADPRAEVGRGGWAPRRSSAQPNTANLPSERPHPGSPPSSPLARQPPQRRQSPAGLKRWLPNVGRRKPAFPIVVRLIRRNRKDVNNVFCSSHRRRTPFR